MTEAGSVPWEENSPAADVVDRLIACDPGAWKALFDEFFPKMYSFAYFRTGDASLAEDVASEVFAAAAQRISRFRRTGAPISAWLYRIARNLTADELDRRRRRPQVPIEGLDLEAAGISDRLDASRDLAQAMTRLTREQQEVIALRFYNDCTLEETAQAMEKSVGAVKVLQHRALLAMRRQLRPGGS